MRHFTTKSLLIALALIEGPAGAIPLDDGPPLPYWQCVPIARMLSGIQIYGDAHTWWGQADGRYRRGEEPRKGAVLAFRPYGNMRLGHVAAVTKILDDRTILVTHSNWSPINGRRGQIERNVRIVDVSDENDWSRVRVWFAPLQDLGGTAWPTHGFIYADGKPPMALPGAKNPTPVIAVAPLSDKERKIAAKAEKKRLKADKEAAEERAEAAEKAAKSTKAPKPTGRIAYLGKLLPKLK